MVRVPPFHQRWLLIMLCSLLLLGCSTPQQQPLSADLSTEIAETSGLICQRHQQFLTINDSGQQPLLYQMNGKGNIKARIRLPVANKDWEAMTTDGDWLYLADSGNNSGARDHGLIHRFRLNDSNTVSDFSTLSYRFRHYDARTVLPYQHSFDVEAIAATDQALYLFNKNWTGGPTQVYRLDKTAKVQELTPIAQVSNLPGIVTDATWSARHQVFVLVGYNNIRANPLSFLLTGNWSAFIAIVDSNFQLRRTIPLTDAQQVEGVCLDTAEYVWLSQERYRDSKAKLWRVAALATLLE